MNLRTLQAHKGLSNVIYFTIRDRDRKLQNLSGETLRAYVVNPETRNKLITTTLERTVEVGKYRLTLSEGDLRNIDAGLYYMYVTRTQDTQGEYPVFSDQDNNIKMDLDISEQTGNPTAATQTDTDLSQAASVSSGDPEDIFVSDILHGNLEENYSHAQHSMAIYPDTYTGNIQIQASCVSEVPSTDPDSKHWFLVKNFELADESNVIHETFVVNCNWIRVVSYPESANSSITTVMLRN